jgi:hypothetical protein
MQTLNDKLNKEDKMNQAMITYMVEKDLKAKYSAILKDDYGVKRKEEAKVKSMLLPRLMKIAAVFATAICCIVLIKNAIPESPESIAQNLVKSTIVLSNQQTMRKDLTMISKARIAANEAFLKGDYTAAISTLKSVANADSANVSDHFYLGISYLKMDKPDPSKAVKHLQFVSTNTPYEEEVRWFIALAHVLNKDTKAAKTVLNEIVNKKSYKHAEAEKLLKKLN